MEDFELKLLNHERSVRLQHMVCEHITYMLLCNVGVL